jgi:hypothetical protein
MANSTGSPVTWRLLPLRRLVAIVAADVAPEQMFCAHGLTYAYYFSRHSYSAIRNSASQRFDHAERLRAVHGQARVSA